MDEVEVTSHLKPVIFPSQSISLLIGPSNSGKSTYLQKIFENSHLCFEEQPKRIIIINTNKHCSFYSLEQVESNPWPLPVVENYLAGEFDINLLEKGDIIVFEDILEVTHDLRQVINVISHHVGLIHTFLISHACLGTKKFELLSYIHRVILFCRASSVCRLANFISQTFYYDPETRDYLKKIISYAQTKGQILHIELNVTAGLHQAKHLAITHVLDFITKGFLIIFPFLNTLADFSFQANQLVSIEVKNKTMLPDSSQLPEHAFVLLNSSQVNQVKYESTTEEELELDSSHEDTEQACLDKDSQQWKKVVQQMTEDIEGFIPAKRMKDAKNLLKEIIANKDLCISSDGRRIRIREKHGNKSAMVVDFIRSAIRPSSPNEAFTLEYHIYRDIVDTLIKNNTPTSLFRNKLMLERKTSLRQRPTVLPRRRGHKGRQLNRRPFFQKPRIHHYPAYPTNASPYFYTPPPWPPRYE